MTEEFLKALQKRRSIYAISGEQTVPEDKVEEIVSRAVQYVPSAFNSQSGRVVLLFGKNHAKLWDIVRKELQKIVPAERFAPTEEKIRSFEAGYGTILYFDDTSVTDGFAQKFSTYRDNFGPWAQQSSGMLQLAIWTALEAEGLGASLQHYNPLIDEQVHSEWKLPQNWKLIAEMPFGAVAAPAGEKESMPVEERLKVVKD